MPILKKAFCCATLQNGTLTIGWLGCSHITLSTIYLLIDLQSNNREYLSKLSVTIIPIVAVQYALYVSLIVAASTQNRYLLTPWLSFFGVEFICVNIVNLLSFDWEWGHIFFVLRIANAIMIYLWLIVFSYYQELREQHSTNKRDLIVDV